MSIVETVLVFVGIPVGAFALIWALTSGISTIRAPRYRPGGGWPYGPVWYLPHPQHTEPVSALQAAGAADAARQLTSSALVPNPIEAAGGASGEW